MKDEEMDVDFAENIDWATLNTAKTSRDTLARLEKLLKEYFASKRNKSRG
jgi:hypothetical protein